MGTGIAIAVGVLVLLLVIIVLKSLHSIGPSEVGLLNKRFGFKKLTEDDPIAFKGEAGFQAELMMPGLRFKLWPVYGVQKFPWVQVPAGEIGVVISQVGAPLPIGAKSAFYNPVFGNFTDLRAFLDGGGQKGVQRPVLPPGTLVPIHPVAFLVLTAHAIYGMPVSPDMHARAAASGGLLGADSFGLTDEQLQVVVIAPIGDADVIGIVTALEGEPLLSGDIASRLGGYDDVSAMERNGAEAAAIIEILLGNKNTLHNNYQDFQKFMDAGGKIGLQHDPLMYGAYLLNPFLIRVELTPMLLVKQGEVAVVKAYVGLPTLDTSGTDFKFGSIVAPGHRGIWAEPLRTGKYPINPRCYAAEIVPTSILTLNWSNLVSSAHSLDANLAPIEGKSREGFVFTIELQVQIHVPDTKAPKVISMVGTMLNLVNEVLSSAVGNHFRNTLQDQEAIRFIETRMQVQQTALEAVSRYLSAYEVETRGVYIQNVQFPGELVTVLTQREIAKQEKATFEEQERAQTARINVEKAKGTADMQGQLASSQVSIDINRNRSEARKAEAEGEAAFVERTGQAEATRVQALGLAEAKAVEALGLARAEGFKAQREALGTQATAIVAVANAVAEGRLTIVPEVLVTGGGGAVEGLAASLMRYFGNGSPGQLPPAPPRPPAPETPATPPASEAPASEAAAPAAEPSPIREAVAAMTENAAPPAS
jgi:regulator of protease activity HflC (stomatin/prohibitin superfamily)